VPFGDYPARASVSPSTSECHFAAPISRRGQAARSGVDDREHGATLDQVGLADGYAWLMMFGALLEGAV
jgi:hypothetical protein